MNKDTHPVVAEHAIKSEPIMPDVGYLKMVSAWHRLFFLYPFKSLHVNLSFSFKALGFVSMDINPRSILLLCSKKCLLGREIDHSIEILERRDHLVVCVPCTSTVWLALYLPRMYWWVIFTLTLVTRHRIHWQVETSGIGRTKTLYIQGNPQSISYIHSEVGIAKNISRRRMVIMGDVIIFNLMATFNTVLAVFWEA